MNNKETSIPVADWLPTDIDTQPLHCVKHLESDQLLRFPQLPFALQPAEQQCLDHLLDQQNVISFDKYSQRLTGCPAEAQQTIRVLFQRFRNQVEHFLHLILPEYSTQLIPGRIHYWSQLHKEKLHIDTNVKMPAQNLRVLRFFTNTSRSHTCEWQLGDTFSQVCQRFQSQLAPPTPGLRKLLHILKRTKRYRSRYDHYMLQLARHMRTDQHYQHSSQRNTIALAPQTSWLLFTDSIPHACLAGHHLLEQTFYLPIEAMQQHKQSPQHILQQQLGQVLLG